MRKEVLERTSNLQIETFKRENSLPRLIDYFNNNFQKEGLPADWADMPSTGFEIDKQMALLLSQTQTESDFGERERLSIWLGQTEEDIRGFILEYLKEGLVFPINYRIGIVDGQQRIVAPLYGEKLMVDTVSKEERDGVVKKTISEIIEPFFLKSSGGAIAVMVSPSGPSGIKDSKGNSIVFPDSQTYILQKFENEILGFTVRTDFTYQEHREFIRRLTGQEISPSAPAYEYISSPALLEPDPQKKPLKISEIVDVMQNTRFDITGNSLMAYKDRKWTEIYNDMKNRKKLLEYDSDVSDIVSEFREYVLENKLSEGEIKEALAATILKITRVLRFDKNGANWNWDLVTFGRGYSSNNTLRYGRVLEEVQSLPGCAGGGVIVSLTPRLGISSGEGWEYHIGECVVCGLRNTQIGPCNICKNCEKEFDAREEIV